MKYWAPPKLNFDRKNDFSENFRKIDFLGPKIDFFDQKKSIFPIFWIFKIFHFWVILGQKSVFRPKKVDFFDQKSTFLTEKSRFWPFFGFSKIFIFGHFWPKIDFFDPKSAKIGEKIENFFQILLFDKFF